MFLLCQYYAPQDRTEKSQLFQKFPMEIILLDTIYVFVYGDFISVRSSDERDNYLYRTKDSESLNMLILNNNLIDVKMQTDRFTWFGAQKKKSRIDRVLINCEWSLLSEWSL